MEEIKTQNLPNSMEENFISNLLKKPVWVAFVVSWLIYLIGLFLFSQFVWDVNTYQLDYTGNSFDASLSGYRRIDYLRYALSPLWVVSASAVVLVLIKSGLLIARIEIKTALLFKIILLGFLILSLPFWIKSVWLILIEGSYTPDEVKYFFPGSIVSFIDISGMKEMEIRTLAQINLYHLGFMLFTAWQIAENSELRFFSSFILVLSTYGLGIVLLRYLILMFTT